MKRADRKKDWAIKTRVDKLFDQITFRSNVVYIYLFFIHSFLWYVYQRLGLSEFFFVLCLHFSYYIIRKTAKLALGLFEYLYFLISLMFSYKSFHIKKIFRWYVMRNYTIYIRKKNRLRFIDIWQNDYLYNFWSISCNFI